jgi:hypothetical protein
VLAVIPLDLAHPCRQSEIALRTQVPQDAAVSGAVSVVDFDDPVLIRDGMLHEGYPSSDGALSDWIATTDAKEVRTPSDRNWLECTSS